MFKYENVSELPALHSLNLTDWGPKRDPLFIVIPFTALFAAIFLTGVIGNVSTCIVIARNKSMHTATNYYLFSLAISDLLLLISGLPQEMYFIWSKYPYIFGEVFCVLQGFAAETSANATVLTITAFTFERYIAICHPFLSQTMSKLSRAIRLVIMIWIVAICLAVPQAMSFGIVYESPQDDDHYICNVKRDVIPHAFLISTVLFFVTPMSLISVLYILIGLQLRQSTVGPVRGGSIKLSHLVQRRPSRVTCTERTHQTSLLTNNDCEAANIQISPQEEKRRHYTTQSQSGSQHVVKMLVAVVVAFFICWAPFHAQRLLAIYGQSDTWAMVTTLSALTYISGVLYYLSTTINPVLYHIMSHKFRMAFKETYAVCLPKRRRHARIPQHYSNLQQRLSQDKTYHPNPSKEKSAFETKLAQQQQPPTSSIGRQHFQKRKRLCKNGKSVVYFNTASVVHTKDFEHYENSLRDKKETAINETNGLRDFNKVKDDLSLDNCKKLEEIEIFREEQLIIRAMEKGKSFCWNENDTSLKGCINCWKQENLARGGIHGIDGILTKSLTLPDVTVNNSLMGTRVGDFLINGNCQKYPQYKSVVLLTKSTS